MKTEKTRLQKIKEQLEKKMTRAIVEAIENGAQVQKFETGLCIDGVYLINAVGDLMFSVILHVDAPEIDELMEPSASELQRRADELRAELEEIEEQIKSNKS